LEAPSLIKTKSFEQKSFKKENEAKIDHNGNIIGWNDLLRWMKMEIPD